MKEKEMMNEATNEIQIRISRLYLNKDGYDQSNPSVYHGHGEKIWEIRFKNWYLAGTVRAPSLASAKVAAAAFIKGMIPFSQDYKVKFLNRNQN